MLAYQDGSDEAFSYLYGRYYSIILTYSERFLPFDQAQDCTQIVFVKLIRFKDKFDPQYGMIFSWLYTVARNEALTLIRTMKRKKTFEYFEWQRSSSYRDKSDEIDSIVWDTVNELSTPKRTVICMRIFQGLEYGVIASILNVSIGTVKSRLFRSKEILQRNLLGKV